MVEGRVVTAGLMFAIFVGAVAMAALTFPEGARFLPLVIGIPGLVLAGIQFVTEWRASARHRPAPAETPEDSGLLGRELRMFGWFFLFLGGIIAFGFPYAGPVLIGAYLRFSWREKWTICLGAMVLAWAILYGVFEHGLGLPLFDGLLTGRLLG